MKMKNNLPFSIYCFLKESCISPKKNDNNKDIACRQGVSLMEKEKDFLEIRSLSREENKRLIQEIEKRLDEKKNKGILSEKEIREIEEIKLEPNVDIKDVMGVWEDMMFKPKK